MKKYFDENIIDILNEKQIENIPLKNIDTLKYIFSDKEIKKSLYKGFKTYYNIMYGNDMDWCLMKVQDMLYRIHLLVNCSLYDNFGITDKNVIKDVVLKFARDGDILLYESVEYNDYDLEIVNDFNLEIRDLLLMKQI
jgi:hypothetical protein